MSDFYTVHPIDAHTWHIEDAFHDYMYLYSEGDRDSIKCWFG